MQLVPRKDLVALFGKGAAVEAPRGPPGGGAAPAPGVVATGKTAWSPFAPLRPEGDAGRRATSGPSDAAPSTRSVEVVTGPDPGRRAVALIRAGSELVWLPSPTPDERYAARLACDAASVCYTWGEIDGADYAVASRDVFIPVEPVDLTLQRLRSGGGNPPPVHPPAVLLA